MPRLKGYKHSEKTKKKIRAYRHTTEAKQNIKLARLGYKVSIETKNKIRESQMKRKDKHGFLNNIETRIKMSETHKRLGTKPPLQSFKGERHPNWKGGITPIVLMIRHSLKYKKWRQVIFIRDNFTCQKCGTDGGWVEVHHYKKSFSNLIEEVRRNIPLMHLYDAAMLYAPMWDISIGITYCRKCHKETKQQARDKITGRFKSLPWRAPKDRL